MFTDLVAAGADIATRPRTSPGQVLADLVVTADQLAALTARGAVAVQLIHTSSDGARRLDTVFHIGPRKFRCTVRIEKRLQRQDAARLLRVEEGAGARAGAYRKAVAEAADRLGVQAGG